MLAQVGPQQIGNCVGSFAFLCVSALFAGALIYAAIRVLRLLTGWDLAEFLKGNKPISPPWFGILAIGIVAGSLATLLTALACQVL